jgi:hypothetical protein
MWLLEIFFAIKEHRRVLEDPYRTLKPDIPIKEENKQTKIQRQANWISSHHSSGSWFRSAKWCKDNTPVAILIAEARASHNIEWNVQQTQTPNPLPEKNLSLISHDLFFPKFRAEVPRELKQEWPAQGRHPDNGIPTSMTSLNKQYEFPICPYIPTEADFRVLGATEKGRWSWGIG